MFKYTKIALLVATCSLLATQSMADIACPTQTGTAPAHTATGPYLITDQGDTLEAAYLPNCATVNWLASNIKTDGKVYVQLDEANHTLTLIAEKQ